MWRSGIIIHSAAESAAQPERPEPILCNKKIGRFLKNKQTKMFQKKEFHWSSSQPLLWLSVVSLCWLCGPNIFCEVGSDCYDVVGTPVVGSSSSFDLFLFSLFFCLCSFLHCTILCVHHIITLHFCNTRRATVFG